MLHCGKDYIFGEINVKRVAPVLYFYRQDLYSNTAVKFLYAVIVKKSVT